MAEGLASQKAGVLQSLRGCWSAKHVARSALGQRAARKFKDSNLGLSRATIEMTELQRWRAQIVIEADTPVVRQAHVASYPETAVAASLGSVRPSTMRQHVHEWRKLGAFPYGQTYVGVVLDLSLRKKQASCYRLSGFQTRSTAAPRPEFRICGCAGYAGFTSSLLQRPEAPLTLESAKAHKP